MPGEHSSPRIVGRYALYDQIASGGMATVHLARLLGPVGFARTVAVKRLHAQYAQDPQFVSMFLDEARLVARISHPNVVPTLDIVANDGELFIVMEYVRGESLARLLRAAHLQGKRVAHETVATLMIGVLHGLHAAHEATSERGEPLGIVHRDVSPHNILVGVDGAARVLDFGVAKAADRIQSTSEGQLKGKIAYMAPEQIHGTATQVTDVYAASVVLWEALTGRRLFNGENSAQVLDRVLRGCTVPPSTHAPGLPPALDALTLRGLHVDPARRFATAREMARGLEDAVRPVAASRIGEWVQGLAQETLSERRERIAAIESDSARHVPVLPRASGGPHPPPPPPPRDVGSEEGTSAAVTDDMILTQRSSRSMLAPRQAPGARGRRRATIVAAGASVLLVAGLLAAFVHVGTPGPRESIVASSPQPAAAPPATVQVSSQPLAPAASESSRALDVPAEAAVATTSLSAPRRTTVLPPAKPFKPAVTPAPAPTPTCTVVTNYDSQGQPHFAEVCK